MADTKFINGKGFLGARSDLSVWIVSWMIYWFLTVASKYPCSLVARLLTFMPSCLAVTNLAVKTQTGGRQCSRSSSSNQDQNCSAGRQGLVVPCLFCLVLCRSPAAVLLQPLLAGIFMLNLDPLLWRELLLEPATSALHGIVYSPWIATNWLYLFIIIRPPSISFTFQRNITGNKWQNRYYYWKLSYKR